MLVTYILTLAATAIAVAAQDPTCGSQHQNAHCPGTLCCSFVGYCNNSPVHCGAGCQVLFGRCDGASSPAPLAPPTPSVDVKCGVGRGGKCPNSLCCSQYGWCGNTDAHCGIGCQNPFGTCNGTPPTPPTPSVDVKCGVGRGGKCPNSLCCSQYGWCGNTDAHCGIGCQNPFGTCNGAPPTPPTPSVDVKCGVGRGGKCPNSLCCSQYGWCGNTDAHCGVGCQNPFGTCNGAPPTPPTPPAPVPIPGINSRCGSQFQGLGCPDGLCCSAAGYCGITTAHCEAGCQADSGICSPAPRSGFTLPPKYKPETFPALAPSTAACTKPTIRKEVRSLTAKQQANYINGIKCLHKAPSRFPSNLGTVSLYDDLVYVHTLSGDLAHLSAQLLPWHRVFTLNFEHLLRTACGYTDPLPYWDWSIDSQAPEKSMVWSNTFIGGDGAANTDCIATGPFANFQVNVPSRHCIKRRFELKSDNGSMMGALYSPAELATIFSTAIDYDSFRMTIEDNPHNSIHGGVGGDMDDPITSANDPVFFLHHANIDRLWWIWQNSKPAHMHSYGGNRNPDSSFKFASPSDHVFMWGMGENFRVDQVLDIAGGGRFCYGYDSISVPTATRPSHFSAASLMAANAPGSVLVNATIVPVVNNSFPVAVKPLNGSLPSPGAFDRTDKFHLRHHKPLNETWLRMMKYSDSAIARVRANEAKVNKIVDLLNAETDMGNFLSGSALTIKENSQVKFVASKPNDVTESAFITKQFASKLMKAVGPFVQ
ncbi:hypothetical protein QVD99_007360 [Batrachochytrium dendrobatidis]|nr:hypothetical protein O5D80_008478 [Batrachochytrium dendrobatidis]KAK5665718.1 hypothetical protein QVD99_007360 [Batrachochytrium dendrobatidis]